MKKLANVYREWSPEERAAYREVLIGLIDQALAAPDFIIDAPEFEGERALRIEWITA